MKTISGIFAMLLVSITISSGQRVEKYYSGYLKDDKKALERKYGKFKRLDHYAGKDSVDDGFGGIWNIENVQEDEDFAPHYRLWRPSNRFYNRGMDAIETTNVSVNDLTLAPKSSPAYDGLAIAFYGYFKGLKTMGGYISVFFWIDPLTGSIDEVAFELHAHWNHSVNMGAAIPPRNYALYEDILKKTVTFDMKNYKFTEKEVKANYCYWLQIPFRNFAGEIDKPDFLEGYYPPNYEYL